MKSFVGVSLILFSIVRHLSPTPVSFDSTRILSRKGEQEREQWLNDVGQHVDCSRSHKIHRYLDSCASSASPHPIEEDSFSWRLTSNGKYHASSAYSAFFLGTIEAQYAKKLWKIWASDNPQV